MRLTHYRDDYKVGEKDGYGNLLCFIYKYDYRSGRYVSIDDCFEYGRLLYQEEQRELALRSSLTRKQNRFRIKTFRMLLDDFGRLIYKKLSKRYGKQESYRYLTNNERRNYFKYRNK